MFAVKILLIVALVAPTFAQKCSSIKPQDQELATKLAKSNLDFSLNTYKALSDEENLIFSPFSLDVALAMAAAGAEGNTLKQMKDVLHLNELGDETKINNAFLSILDSICSNSNFSLSTANRMYLQNNFKVLQNYVQTLEKYYKSNAENVDFAKDADTVAKTINQWVENQTNNTIKDLFPPGSVNPATVLMLVNAIYFNGTWKREFDPIKTRSGDFKTSNGQTIPVSMMNMQSRFKFGRSEELKSKILKLDYVGDRLAMYIILPNEQKGLSALQQKLTPKLLTNLRQQMTEKLVKVEIPKIKLNFKKKMNEVLQKLGMNDLFNPGKSNLSKISEGNLVVSEVVHQAHVNVDEKGTVAAAATGIGIVPTSGIFTPPDTEQFIVDHPFMLIIHDALTDLILFMGHVNNPKA